MSSISALSYLIRRVPSKLLIFKIYEKATADDDALLTDLLNARTKILNLEQQLGGSKARSEVGEKNEYPTINDYLWPASSSGNTYGPTKAHLQYVGYAKTMITDITSSLDGIKNSISPLGKRLQSIGAPKIKY